MSLEEQHDSKSEFKRKRSESPVSTSTACEHADLSEGPNDEYRNKRVKTERPASPAPSCLSLKSDLSMAPPDNFKGLVFPLDFRERPASPTPSYMSLRTDMSMDAPNNFKREQTFHMVTRVGSERAPSPTLSSVSEQTECFVEQPTYLKAEETYHLGPRLLTDNYLKCPVCKSILKDPVSIPCGHNFCRDCINSSWDSCAEDYVCPQCERGFKIRPELNTNTSLAEVVKHLHQAGFSPALPPCSYAGPEDVVCDLCSQQKLKAVKTCLTCDVSFCETHIRNHYTIPALQKHTLSDVTGALEKKLSTQNLPTDNFSSTCGEEEKDRSMSESGLNTSMANEAAGISTPTDVKKDITNATNLELMYSKLQQEVLGLKESFSKFKKHNTKKDKCVGFDDEESYKDSDEEENENSYDEKDSFNYDMDNDSEMDKSDENDNDDEDEDEYNGYEDDEYDEEEDNNEYDEDDDNSDEEDEYDVDEYGY